MDGAGELISYPIHHKGMMMMMVVVVVTMMMMITALDKNFDQLRPPGTPGVHTEPSEA